MMPLSYHLSNLSFIAQETMQLLLPKITIIFLDCELLCAVTQMLRFNNEDKDAATATSYNEKN